MGQEMLDKSVDDLKSDDFETKDNEIISAIYSEDYLTLYELLSDSECSRCDMEEYAELCAEERSMECFEVLSEFYDYDKNFILGLCVEYGFFKLFKQYYDDTEDRNNVLMFLVHAEAGSEDIVERRLKIIDYIENQ